MTFVIYVFCCNRRHVFCCNRRHVFCCTGIHVSPVRKFLGNFHTGARQTWTCGFPRDKILLTQFFLAPNEKFPGNFPTGGGSTDPPPNGKLLGNFSIGVRKKVQNCSKKKVQAGCLSSPGYVENQHIRGGRGSGRLEMGGLGGRSPPTKKKV